MEVPQVEAPITAVIAQAPQEKTLKEILEERENELKELEQLEEIQDKGYMEALVEDIDQKTTPAAAKTQSEEKQDEDTP